MKKRAKLMRGFPIMERLLAKIAIDPKAKCWNWTAAKDRDGYGQLRGDGPDFPMLKAHRVAYVVFRGPIPEGLPLDHLCGNRSCVNPAHLEAVTTQENTARAFADLTACAQGHPFTPENTMMSGTHRNCRTCKREAYRRWYCERGGREYRAEQRARAA